MGWLTCRHCSPCTRRRWRHSPQTRPGKSPKRGAPDVSAFLTRWKARGSMARVRLGIAGCGVIGRIHAASARKLSGLVELVAVADVQMDAARAGARAHAGP